MNRIHKPAPFVILSTGHGTMIVSRNDVHMTGPMEGFGVGMQLFQGSLFDVGEIDMALELLKLRRHYHGDGVVALDCGANIGVHTIEWATLMTGWGQVVAFEPQERIYYALAGNIAINNCFNAFALHAAVSSEPGTMTIPNPNYLVPSSFGSLELRQRAGNEFIGQKIDYAANTVVIRKLTLDEIDLPRVDFIKIDIEGMELEALEGARQTIDRSQPIMLLERIKTDSGQLTHWLETRGYNVAQAGINLVAVHKSDKTMADVKFN
jgi:FkbM family methyltransferase